MQRMQTRERPYRPSSQHPHTYATCIHSYTSIIIHASLPLSSYTLLSLTPDAANSVYSDGSARIGCGCVMPPRALFCDDELAYVDVDDDDDMGGLDDS